MNINNWQEKERLWWAKLEQCQSCGEFWATYASYLEDVGSISKHRKLLLKWAQEAGKRCACGQYLQGHDSSRCALAGLEKVSLQEIWDNG